MATVDHTIPNPKYPRMQNTRGSDYQKYWDNHDRIFGKKKEGPSALGAEVKTNNGAKNRRKV